MVNKTIKIMEHLSDRGSSIVFISETWLRDDVSDVNALVKSFGYVLVHNRRKNRTKSTGGGVGILLRLNMKYKHIHVKSYSLFEITVVKLFCVNHRTLMLVSIYRVLFVPVKVFMDEIIELFEQLAISQDDVILAGDVNIHMEEDGIYSNRFNDILSTFNFIQHVKSPTHKHGHTLDIVAIIEGSVNASGFGGS